MIVRQLLELTFDFFNNQGHKRKQFQDSFCLLIPYNEKIQLRKTSLHSRRACITFQLEAQILLNNGLLMIQNVYRLVSCLLALGLVSCTSAFKAASLQGSQVIVSPNDTREYDTLVLGNQLAVLMVSDPSVDKSAAALSVGVGLLQDPMNQQGMAHYLEHMLFMGTERYPDPNGYTEFMSQNGGSSNAYTWLNITNYMFEINNDAYEQALDRFSDFFKSPKLYAEYSEKEKNAVNAEWSMRREMDFLGRYKLDRSMMGEHPANRFLIGNLETLSDKETGKLHPQMVEFYQQYYSANIMKVALVSNQPIAQMKKLAQQYFANITNKKIAKPEVAETLDFKKFAGKRIHYVPSQDIKQLILDFTITNNQSDYNYKPNYFVAYLLGSEMPGTPAFELKKSGLIASLNSSATPDFYGNYGNLTLDIRLTEAGMKQRAFITKVVMSYIEKIKNEGVDKKYYKEIKTSLDNRFRFLEKSNAFGYASSLSEEMQSYPIEQVVSAPYSYNEFNADSINRLLAQLTPERLRIWYVSQQEPFEHELHFYNGKYKIVDIDKKEIKSWGGQSDISLNLPKVNRLLPEKFDIKTNDIADQEKPLVVYDKNGVKVWHYPSQNYRTQPKGVLRIYFNSPERVNNIEGQILFALWNDLYQLRQSALITEASIAGMGLGFTEANGLELFVSGFTDKQPLLLEKALQSMVFNVDEASFNQALDRYIRGLKNAEKQFPFYQLFGEFNHIIASSGYENEQLITSAKQLRPSHLAEFMQRVMANNQIRIFAFGNYNQADIHSFVEKVNSVMPDKRQVTDYTRTKIWSPQQGEKLTYKKDLEVSDVAVYDLHVHSEPSARQEARARVLRSHLRTVAFDKLRTEEQLAYAVTVIAPKIREYTAIGFAIQTPVKNVAEMTKRFDAFKEEYLVQLNAITEQEFTQLKNSVLVSLKEKPKNLSEEQASMLNDWYLEKWNFDSREILIAEVEKVTLEDIKQFYQETAINDEAARMTIQLRGSKFKDNEFAKISGETEIKNLADYHRKATYQ